MNKAEFLKELAASKEFFEWKIQDSCGRMVITGHSKQKSDLSKYCSITGVCLFRKKLDYNLMDYDKAGVSLGLPEDVIREVVFNSDDYKDTKEFNPELRMQLLKAVGLKEKK
jgi:hypothetical protein